jgi:hypothetical protein
MVNCFLHLAVILLLINAGFLLCMKSGDVLQLEMNNEDSCLHDSERAT